MANPPPLPSPTTGLPTPPPVDVHTFIWLFFRFDGRVGREVYWLAILFLPAIVGLTGPFSVDPATGEVAMSFGPIQSFILAVTTISSIAVSMKRLHDLDMTGLFAIGLLVFPISVILTLWLGVRKGKDQPNKYGWQRDVRPTQPPPQSIDEDDQA